MIKLDQWQQSAVFEPDNPGQQIQEHYTGLPGNYSSFYWNRVPVEATLSGVFAEARSKGVKAGLIMGALLAVGSLVYLRAKRK